MFSLRKRSKQSTERGLCILLTKLGKTASLRWLSRDSVGIPGKYTRQLFPAVTQRGPLVTSGLLRSGLVLY